MVSVDENQRTQLSVIQTDDGFVYAQITFTTLDGKPASFNDKALELFGSQLDQIRVMAEDGNIFAVVFTGTDRTFHAGADLKFAVTLPDAEAARRVAKLGHDVYAQIRDISVPTFSWINGSALGGGLEVALFTDFRVMQEGARLGLPEVSIGLIPGWGGCYNLPRIVGLQNALDVIVKNSLNRNTLLTATAALDMNLVDEVLPELDFSGQALLWMRQELQQPDVEQTVAARRSEDLEHSGFPTGQALQEILSECETWVKQRYGSSRPQALRAIKLIEFGLGHTYSEAARAEQDALTEYLVSPNFRRSIYAWRLTSAKPPKSKTPPRDFQRVRIVGSGLMARQIAAQILRSSAASVQLTDISAQQLANAHEFIASQKDAAQYSGTLVTDGSPEALDPDLIIEAVTERADIKRQVLQEQSALAGDDTVIATNTSALSVTQLAEAVRLPQRFFGIHFFNPVRQMPLVEVVSTPHSAVEMHPEVLNFVNGIGKTPVSVQDSPGFIVNRLLLLVMSKTLEFGRRGYQLELLDSVLSPLGLPMSPLALIDLVGAGVSQHVLEYLVQTVGTPYQSSPGLAKIVAEGARFYNDDGDFSHEARQVFAGQRTVPDYILREELLTALASQIQDLQAQGAVKEFTDIDRAMILGAGWPLHLGGITPYLKDEGYLP